MKDTIYDNHSMRDFLGINLGQQQVPDATTLLKFLRLLEEHAPTKKRFSQTNAQLSERGLLLHTGSMVDATIIEAPPSKKNKDKTREPEMNQTMKRI